MTKEELLALREQTIQEHLRNGEIDQIPKADLQRLRDAETERSSSITDEMHPDISFADRAIAKNFASSPDSTIAYLKKQHPDMIFKNIDGEILMRNPSETSYKVLDPSEFEMQDMTDVVTDVGQGTAEGIMGTLGAVGGAVTGGLASLGIGAVPAAVAGAAGGRAVAGIGSEYVKQGIGSFLGIPDNINHTNAIINGGVSAALPVVGNRLKAGYNYVKGTVIPKAVGFTSDISEDVLKNIHADNAIRGVIASDEAGFLKNQAQDIATNINNYKNKAGQALNAVSGNNIDATQARDYLLNLINGKTGTLTPTQRKEAVVLSNRFKGMADTQLNVGLDTARSLRNEFGQMAKDQNLLPETKKMASDTYRTMKDSIAQAAPDRNAYNVALGNYHNVADQIDENALIRKLTNTSPTNNEGIALKRVIDKTNKDFTTNQGAQALELEQAKQYLQKYGGVDLNKLSREVTSHAVFTAPKKLSEADIRARSAGAAIGGAAGWGAGGGAWGAAGGALAGGLAGKTMFSPYMIKQVADKTKGLENLTSKGLNQINPFVLKAAPKSMYNLMSTRED